MRIFLIIVTLVLSSVFSGSLHTIEKNAEFTGSFFNTPADYNNGNASNVKSFALVPSGSFGLSSEDTSTSSFFRSYSSSRRTQISSKSSSRTIKAGKVIDKHSFCSFQTEISQFSSGIHSTGRYIHSICQLRL